MCSQIAVISNIYFEPYWRTHIRDILFNESQDNQTNYISYYDFKDYVSDIKKADIIAVCLNFDELYTNLSNDVQSGKVTYEDIEKDCVHRCKELYSNVKAYSNASVIWFGFEDYFCCHNNICGNISAFDGVVDKLNLALNDMLKEDIFLDFKRLIATVGIANAYDSRGKYRWNAPYSRELIHLIVEEIHKQYLIHTGNTKKCLVIDCDNVLWGGILSEDGIEGIQIGNSGLGRPFQDFQRFLLDMYYHGVILTVCSKNDEDDVLRVFREHSGMILKEEHIACFKVNWNNKAHNINDICKELNISLDSMVFVDDSEFEVDAINSILPDVTTILYNRERIYKDLSCFNLKRKVDIDNIIKRNSTYRSNVQRTQLLTRSATYEEYLQVLETQVDIHLTCESELARISELSQRTNQCTNGVRYTVDKLQQLMYTENYRLYSVFVSDRFSDLGLVGAIGISGSELDLFSLSCRSLGRNVEDKMFDVVRQHYVSSYRFNSTNKNDKLLSRLKNMLTERKVHY